MSDADSRATRRVTESRRARARSTAPAGAGRAAAPRRRAGVGSTAARLTGLSGVAGLLLAAGLTPAVMTAGAAVNAGHDYWSDDLSSTLPTEQAPQRSVILAADGSKIAEFFSENRHNVTFEQIAPIARKAIVAIEDDRFYSHGPIDPRGTLRALANNSSDAGGRQGGSTLTQQYVKNVLLNAAVTKEEKRKATEISLRRKLQELKLAGVVEQKMTKDQILTGYLNIAYFGDGAYGIETAAQHYFKVPASRLSTLQAATLAGLVQNPVGYAPTQHPKAATTRRNLVLGRMRDTGVITAAQAKELREKPLGLNVSNPDNGCTSSRYPFYCQWVRETLSTDPVFGATQAERDAFLYRGGLTIKTHLQPKVMDAVQRVADEALGRDNAFATALAVVQPGTGQVLGFAQNRVWGSGDGRTQVVYPASRTFQPGSTFKPITYAAGLENGFPVNGSIDAPVVFRTPLSARGIRNDSKADAGWMNAGTATARSSNTWFASLEVQTGVRKVAQMADRLGMSMRKNVVEADIATTLGVDSASPLDMASVYATFAAHGRACRPVGIASITDSSGQKVDAPSADCHQAIRPGIADAVTAALAQTVDGTDPARTGKGLGIGRPVAAKSGTTENNVAAWFTGYTPQAATAVWIGDPDRPIDHPVRSVSVYGRRVSGYGARAAGPVWQNAMRAIMAGQPVQQFAPVGPAEVAGTTTVVPDVRGLSAEQAIQVVQAAGLDVQVAPKAAAPVASTPKDTVVVQAPAAGSTIGLQGSVTLTLSAGSDVTKKVPPRTGG